MGRHKLYSSGADRQRAYRERTHARSTSSAGGTGDPAPARLKRGPSRPARIAAIEAEIQNLRQEYLDWLESLPDSLAESEQAARLAETIDQLEAAADVMAEVEPPRGFGRD